MSTTHDNARLETFCDGVFAIALTLLVIDLNITGAKDFRTTAEFWLALRHLVPSVLTFLLSFGVVLITWVNHHEALKLVDKSSATFIYANGVMLLGIVFIPFPTRLLGETLLTNHAAPAVVLYSANYALQAVGWILLSRTARLPKPLTRTGHAAVKMRKIGKDGYFALAFYTTCAVAASWLPMTIASVITAAFLVWLIYGIRIKTDPA